ncbi:MAG TPA: UDP-N-acetylmuramate:L-alanyl-gamma-D-glutamyl-meso-diaminopimelate ligase [Burkholderiaceae bacterium]|nr:UDP-N-acetylmuramate:L-alanyl-gamma-D-glutamyl-meso-diaminopimelate ligase [Burkholderiaceae bacterium]
MHIHVVGIGGTFMGGLARLAQEAGHRVTGCDGELYPPMSEQLAAAGIDVVRGYGADQLGLRPDAWVVGNVATRGMPLVEALLDAGTPIVSGPQWIAEHVLRGRRVIAVAGTHGKTTTASMVAWILDRAGLAPGFLIGGVPTAFGTGARLGAAGRSAGDWFVIEADEYDTAFFDKRSKFVHYFPTIAILNNLEFDHADIFPDLASIETQFHHLVRCVPGSGRLVVNRGDAALARVLARGCWTPVVGFDAPDAWHANAISEHEIHAFDVCRGDARVGRAELPLAGAHNRSNAIAAIAAAGEAGVAPAAAIAALADFPGVRRRLELRGEAGGVRVYDDFAHHPTAIAATVQGLRARIGEARILAVVEPRSNTMRMGVLAPRLAPSLRGADLVFCLAPAAGTSGAGAPSWNALEALAPLGDAVTVCTAIDSLVAAIARAARPGDHVLVMSNGAFGGIHERLLAALRAGRDGRDVHGRRESGPAPQALQASR